MSATASCGMSFSGSRSFKSDTRQTTATNSLALDIPHVGAALKSQPVAPAGVLFAASRNGIRRILSVDDEPGILLTRQPILEKAGYGVLSAVDGEQALHFFDAHAVDLVLLDYLMPRMDGGAVAQEMKKHKPLVPVIIVSGSPVPEDTLTCVDCFIRKGEGPALLLAKVEQLLAAVSTGAIDSTRDHSGPRSLNGMGDG